MKEDVAAIIAGINGSVGFSQAVRDIVWELDVTHIEAVLIWCERTGTDVEHAAELVKRDAELQFAIQVEAEDARVLPKTSRLPI